MLTRFPKGAQAGIVLLHGRGGSARDILSLLDHAALPDIGAAAPEAPGNSWWPTSFLAPTAQMEPFVTAGLRAVAAAVNALRDQGLPIDRIWLAGFSQGACLALEAFARQADWGGVGLAGVFGFSGGLVGTADAGPPDARLMGQPDKALSYPALSGQAWISVHERDPHIPLKRVQDSIAALQSAGAAVQSQIYPGPGHAILSPDIVALRAALNR
jgi:phospholipase/carboxylesterase